MRQLRDRKKEKKPFELEIKIISKIKPAADELSRKFPENIYGKVNFSKNCKVLICNVTRVTARVSLKVSPQRL